MHQHVITVEQFADIHANMEVYGGVDKGPVVTAVGRHPALGSCIVMHDGTSEVVLLSEIPFGAAGEQLGKATDQPQLA